MSSNPVIVFASLPMIVAGIVVVIIGGAMTLVGLFFSENKDNDNEQE